MQNQIVFDCQKNTNSWRNHHWDLFNEGQWPSSFATAQSPWDRSNKSKLRQGPKNLRFFLEISKHQTRAGGHHKKLLSTSVKYCLQRTVAKPSNWDHPHKTKKPAMILPHFLFLRSLHPIALSLPSEHALRAARVEKRPLSMGYRPPATLWFPFFGSYSRVLRSYFHVPQADPSWWDPWGREHYTNHLKTS